MCDVTFLTAFVELFHANMDIQFITDVYSCVNYIFNYLCKSRGELSKLLYKICKEITKGNRSLFEKLRELANTFLHSSEFSAQECAYYLLSMPLSICSRQVVFINTSPPERRIRVVKSKRELEQLPEDSDDVFISNSLEPWY